MLISFYEDPTYTLNYGKFREHIPFMYIFTHVMNIVVFISKDHQIIQFLYGYNINLWVKYEFIEKRWRWWKWVMWTVQLITPCWYVCRYYIIADAEKRIQVTLVDCCICPILMQLLFLYNITAKIISIHWFPTTSGILWKQRGFLHTFITDRSLGRG